MNLNLIKTKLNNYHKNKASIHLDNFSDIAGNQFPGEFNVSGFHKQILNLHKNPQSIWGIDRCLRIQEIPDQFHSYLFHMAIFAKSIDLQNNFINPFEDKRFHKLQEEIITQFLGLLKLFKIDLKEVEITYLDGITFGGTSAGRDRLLKRKYSFPSDSVSRSLLKGKVKLFPVKSIANLDINVEKDSLVGPRLEVAYKGIEIGTIVFNCFKISNGNLKPINYIGGYAIGLERLVAALQNTTFLNAVDRYNKAYQLLCKNIIFAKSSLFTKEILEILFGAEALAIIPNKLSKKQKERITKLKKKLRNNFANLGIKEVLFKKLIKFFNEWKYL